jgi:hypothetical protein
MPVQLRTYTIVSGALHQFATEWQQKIRPVRENVGFQILGAWTVEATEQFVWLLQYEGTNSWEVQDQKYFTSEERRAMDPDPARLIVRMEQHFVEPVR